MRSTLGDRARASGLHMVVPAFHGHAHNRLCQLRHHILMSSGFGLEDLETCERVFAGSNAVARLTRHATAFHRRQFIDLYFQQWDADKYENLGSALVLTIHIILTSMYSGQFLLNNYKQALEILQEMPLRIQTLTSGREISDTQFTDWLIKEREYLESKQSEPEADILGVEYVELLQKYAQAR